MAAGDTAQRARRTGETRDRILDASLRLFARDGYEGAAIRSIAREAGISDPTLYHHFSSKREIFRALLKPPADAFPAHSSRGPGPLVEAVVDGLMVWCRDPDLIRLVVARCMDDDSDALSFSTEMSAAYLAQLEPLLASCRTDSAGIMAQTVLYCATGRLVDAMIEHGHGFAAYAEGPLLQAELTSLVATLMLGWCGE